MTITILGWIATILCIMANYLVVKKKNGFLIWLIGTGILLFLAWLRKDWSQVFLFTIYQYLNLTGYLNWRKEEKL